MNFMNKRMFFASCLLVFLLASPAWSLVNYEAGQMELNGVLLLQDAGDANTYYYLPPAPRVSERSDGGLELSLVKFVDPKGDTSGGLLHMLVTFTIPDEAAPGPMTVTATLNYQKLIKPVADFLEVPDDEEAIIVVNTHSTTVEVLP